MEAKDSEEKEELPKLVNFSAELVTRAHLLQAHERKQKVGVYFSDKFDDMQRDPVLFKLLMQYGFHFLIVDEPILFLKERTKLFK